MIVKVKEENRLETERRKFLKTTFTMFPLMAGAIAKLPQALAQNLDHPPNFSHQYHQPEDYLHTVCLGCNTGCPSKVRIHQGKAIKIVGNPYAPWTKWPHLDYSTPLVKSLSEEGAMCPRGEAGIMTVYDKYRLKKVLKRDGPRGSNKWKTIDFHQAVDEIVNGGKLFAHIPGEENRYVEGLKAIWALKDAKVMKEMAKFIEEEIYPAAGEEGKKQKINEFKEKFRDYLDALIDPDHPDFGPKNNQFLFVYGRLKGGRSEFFKRFVQDTFGSNNFHGHTTVCQGSLYFTGKAMSYQYGFDEKKSKFGWMGEKKFYWQGDLQHAKFVIFVGASPFEGNYGPPYRAPRITEGLVSGRLKYVVVDPRFSKTASQAWKWIPIKPGGEGALALGMIRYILENHRYDERYLTNANRAAAQEDKEPTWTNASWLIKIKDGRPTEFLRGSDIGLHKKTRTVVAQSQSSKENIQCEFDYFVVVRNGQPVPFDPNDVNNPIHGDLFVSTTLNGIPVKSALQCLLEESQKYTIKEWGEICDVGEADIEEIAREFTSYGKQACADIHRGVSQHTNGFYNVLAWYSLNLLIGNYDWQGGMVQAATYDFLGEKAGGPFNFKNNLHPNRLVPFGINILRNGKYEETTIFSGYPAKRPWHTLATDVYQEILPSVGDAYPYPIKVLLLYMGAPGYSLPAGQTQIAVLSDPKKVPLFIASDIVIGTTSMYADYIIPDLSYLERWEFHGSHPSILWKVQTVRQPVIPPQTETVRVFGEEMPISLEAFMLAVAEKMNLPGFGKDGLDSGLDLFRPEDFYLRMVANLAFGEAVDGSEAVPEADAVEETIFLKARRHLPLSVFDPEKWKRIVDTHWKRVVYLLNRGGRFQNYKEAFDEELVKNKYGKLINLYCEKVAKIKNSMTGENFLGIATYSPPADSLGRPIIFKTNEFHLITYREIFHTKTRTCANMWLLELFPENYILINPVDAQKLGFRDGEIVKVISDSNPEGVWDLPNFRKIPIIGKLRVIAGIKPGVIAFSLGHGNWGYNAYDVQIDNLVIKGESYRGKGINANAAMMIDPHLKNVCLQDLIGGSVCFYDSPVRLERAY